MQQREASNRIEPRQLSLALLRHLNCRVYRTDVAEEGVHSPDLAPDELEGKTKLAVQMRGRRKEPSGCLWQVLRWVKRTTWGGKKGGYCYQAFH